MDPEPKDPSAEAAGFARYLRVLPREARREELRDLDGKVLASGDAVLCNPSAPWEFRQDSPANRALFLRLGNAWSDQVRQQVWFPPLETFPAESRAQLDGAASARKQFLGRVRENIESSAGTPFPLLRVPVWYDLLPWKREPLIRRVEAIADLTPALLGFLEERSGPPAGLPWPGAWLELLAQLNALQVHSVAGRFRNAHAVVGFVTRLNLSPDAPPEIAALDQGVIDAVGRIYRDWASARFGRWPGRCRRDQVFFAIGTAGELPAHGTHLTAGDHWMVFSSVRGNGQWTAPPIEPFGERAALGDFLNRLLPETQNERLLSRKKLIWAPQHVQ